MSYNVGFCLDDLNGHPSDRVIKIKLSNGETRDIDGLQFANACIGGDDIIYIKEIDPLKEAWGRGIEDFVQFAEKIMKVCSDEYHRMSLEDDDYDPCDILHIENEIAKTADFYIKKCNLQKYVKDIVGYYEPGAGDTDEVYAKIRVLKDYMCL